MQKSVETLPDGSRIVVVRNIGEDVAAALRADLDALVTSFHDARGDAIVDHGDKFDQAASTLLAAIDELARPHTLGFETQDALADAVIEVATAGTEA